MDAAVDHSTGHAGHAHGNGGASWAVAASATLHCLTGCAIGEVLGMVIGTSLGLGNWPTVALSVALAFAFGYALTMRGVLRAGLPFRRALAVALAADTVSIAVMEVVDNAVVLSVPGAMEAGISSALFWLTLAGSLAVAFVVTVPVNRAMISRGRGHAVVHGMHRKDPVLLTPRTLGASLGTGPRPPHPSHARGEPRTADDPGLRGRRPGSRVRLPPQARREPASGGEQGASSAEGVTAAVRHRQQLVPHGRAAGAREGAVDRPARPRRLPTLTPAGGHAAHRSCLLPVSSRGTPIAMQAQDRLFRRNAGPTPNTATVVHPRR
jgi:hypothetical protein